jgi:hypothetical protein
MSILTSAGITFGDATSQTTAATAAALVTTANVLNATAGASVGAVGTYAFLVDNTNSNSNVAAGSTIAGSSLRYGNVSVDACGTVLFTRYSGTPSGTWRIMGYGARPVGNFNDKYVSLFLRIS